MGCCLELHEKRGEHFYFYVKLSGPRRWNPIKEAVNDKHWVISLANTTITILLVNIKINIKVIKIDKEVLTSPRHPTWKKFAHRKQKLCQGIWWKIQKRKAENEFKQNDKKKKKDIIKAKSKIGQLSNLDVSDILVKQNIKSTTKLYALVQEKKNESYKDLASDVLLWSSKKLNEPAEYVADGRSYRAIGFDRAKTSKIKVLRKVAEEDWAWQCEEMFLQRAYEVITNNNIHPYVFAAAQQDPTGVGKVLKYNDHRPSQMWENFKLAPLQIIFETVIQQTASMHG